MREIKSIPKEIAKYSPAELHRFANAIDLSLGTQPQMTAQTLVQKAKLHNCSVTMFPDGTSLIRQLDGEGSRDCETLVELMIAMRLGPTYLNLPLLHRGEPAKLIEFMNTGFVVEVIDTGKRHMVWRSGCEKVTTNSL